MSSSWDKAKENVITELQASKTLNEEEFDNIFKTRIVAENGKAVRKRAKYLEFPPLSFICANPDHSHAFHLNALFILISEGKAQKNGDVYSIRQGE